MLRMENVTKTYQLRRQPVTGLDQATMEIERGDFVSLVGPSGSGKSTLLLMLGGMLSPTSGRVLLDGHSLYERSANERDRAAAMLERVGLGNRLDHKPTELSVGQQQRVALARMLANDPAVILADEPTGNLDPETAAQVIGFLEEFNAEGRTIVMVTHDPRAAQRAKRVIRLVEGRLVGETGLTVHAEAAERVVA